MFTFHWSELLTIVLGGLLLLIGLALLMLHRRNEILQTFLTPESPHLEDDFFRVRQVPEAEEPVGEKKQEEEQPESLENESPPPETVHWGQVQ